MLVIIKYSKRKLKRYLRKCIAFFLLILGILSITLLSVVLIMPRVIAGKEIIQEINAKNKNVAKFAKKRVKIQR